MYVRWAMAAMLCLPIISAQAEHYDTLFRDGRVIDGSGAEARKADVAIMGGRIAAVGDLRGATANRVVNATGRLIVPGFIDLHSHADETTGGGLRSNDRERRAAPNLVAQGITTVVVNQDGRSPASIARQKTQLEERGFGPNAILMVGHNSIRQRVMGGDYERPATARETKAMRVMLREGLEAGAMGLTTGLEYVPSIWSTTEELIALVSELEPWAGVFIAHERSSGADPMWYMPSRHDAAPPTMIDNIAELIRIAEETGVNVVATHIKARGANYWGSSETMIGLISQARDRGVPIFADQYPYNTSGSDGQTVLIPDWVWEQDESGAYSGSETNYKKLVDRALSDPLTAEAVRLDIAHEITRRGGAENIIIMDYPDPDCIGKTLFELSHKREVSPVEMAIVLQREGRRDRPGGARLRGYSMSEKDVEAFMRQSWTASGTDAGIALVNGTSDIHPRFFGTYPRKIHEYALKRGVISLEEAIRSATSLPASIMGLDDRGLVREGYHADLSVINPETIQDTATAFNPRQYPEGVDYVLVGGEFVVENGKPTMARPGVVIANRKAAEGE